MKRKQRSTTAEELRREAEARLASRRREGTPHLPTGAEAARLLHELEVHQIELEMQNEELRRTQDELEESRAKYFDLYDLAPVGYLTLDGDAVIREANLTAAGMLGVPKGRLVGAAMTRFVFQEDQDVYYFHWRDLFQAGLPQVCELRVTGEGRPPLWVRMNANLVREDQTGRPLCRVVMSDIAARKKADEALIRMATRDTLTGLYSRGFFVEEMTRIERGRDFPVSMVVADVDHLKEANDRGGHAAGDALLVRAAKVLAATFRAEDVVARIGGDEFAVLLPATGAASVAESLRRVREGIAADHASHPEHPPLHLSLGAATAETPGRLADVLKTADDNMYRQKRYPARDN